MRVYITRHAKTDTIYDIQLQKTQGTQMIGIHHKDNKANTNSNCYYICATQHLATCINYV